jgi:hypothetical protein
MREMTTIMFGTTRRVVDEILPVVLRWARKSFSRMPHRTVVLDDGKECCVITRSPRGRKPKPQFEWPGGWVRRDATVEDQAAQRP